MLGLRDLEGSWGGGRFTSRPCAALWVWADLTARGLGSFSIGDGGAGRGPQKGAGGPREA